VDGSAQLITHGNSARQPQDELCAGSAGARERHTTARQSECAAFDGALDVASPLWHRRSQYARELDGCRFAIDVHAAVRGE
jgi:hypothetical protein